MEGCHAVDEGECLVICNATYTPGADNVDHHHLAGRTSVLGDVSRLQDGAGVNKIVTMDDRLVWTATGSSSVKRWKAPPRRALRTGMHTVQGLASVSHSRRTSGSSDVQSHRRGFSLGNDISRRFSDDASPPLTASPTSPRFGMTMSASTAFSFAADPLAQDDVALFGIPYHSLVRLVSPNDPYALGSPLAGPGGGGYGGGAAGRRGCADADVATLYSAASVKSVPAPVPRHSRAPLVSPESISAMRSPFRQSAGSTLSPRFTGVPPDVDPNGIPSPRAEYEGRELAAAALPLELYPDAIIQGEHGLVRSIILNDRMHALTIDTAGCVAVWDIARCVFLGAVIALFCGSSSTRWCAVCHDRCCYSAGVVVWGGTIEVMC
jgi:WD repeat-containing protein 48